MRSSTRVLLLAMKRLEGQSDFLAPTLEESDAHIARGFEEAGATITSEAEDIDADAVWEEWSGSS